MAKALPSSQAQLQSALESLRAHGERVTGPRKAMLEVLTSEHGPFTAEELRGRLKSGGECDLVTIYRNLATMEEINLIRRCDFGDGLYRYEFNTGDQHHHHIICRSCHAVETIDICVADVLERMARQMGYSNVTHALEVFGVCRKCQRRKSDVAG